MSIQKELSAAPVIPLRYLVSFNPRPTSDSVGDAVYLPMEAISEFGPADTSRRRPIDELRQGYSYIADGDIAFAKVTPCFENGKGLVARNLPDGQAFATTEVTVMRPSTEVEADYLAWILQSSHFLQQGESHMVGSGGLRRVPDSFVRSYLIPLPDRRAQQSVAGFLDRETARIDTLIEEQQCLIEMLRERRWAVVERGVALLEWNTPLKTVATLVQTGPFGSQLKSAEYEDGGIPVINPSHIVAGEIVPDPRIAVSAEKAEQLARHSLEEGDLIAARRGDLGRCAVVGSSAAGFLCGTGSAVIRLDQARVDPSFAAIVFRSRRNRDALALASVGSTMDNLNSDVIGALRFPAPPLDEQRRLTVELEQATAKIDQLIAETELFIELSKERRAALITAAVTGQIDVREMV